MLSSHKLRNHDVEHECNHGSVINSLLLHASTDPGITTCPASRCINRCTSPLPIHYKIMTIMPFFSQNTLPKLYIKGKKGNVFINITQAQLNGSH